MSGEEAREALRRAGITGGAEIPCVVERVKLKPTGTVVDFRLATEGPVLLRHVYEVDQCHPEMGTRGVIQFACCSCGNPLCLALGWRFQPRPLPTFGAN